VNYKERIFLLPKANETVRDKLGNDNERNGG
jgi:hypothetical protein